VPLIVWGSKVKPRTIDEPVTLVDLNPTVLDIFGLDTDDDAAGESLVPILAGGDAPLSRPIIAEGRLRRSLYAGNGKVIVDLRRTTVEAFDLSADPGELDNLFAQSPDRVAPLLATLGAYFDARAFRAPGYETPYKP
jgi:arylsulfatase A-like enzyme